jgi:hypothetical protein
VGYSCVFFLTIALKGPPFLLIRAILFDKSRKCGTLFFNIYPGSAEFLKRKQAETIGDGLMIRYSLLVLIYLLGVCGRTWTQDLPSWVGPPPAQVESGKGEIAKLLGDDYREPPNWVDLAAWLEELPVPWISDPAILRYYYKCWYELWLNTRPSDDPTGDLLVYPNPSAVEPNVWDTSFIILGLTEGKARAIDLAKRQALAFLPDASGYRNIPPGPLSMAVLRIYKKTGDWYFVQKCYAPLKANHERFIKVADRDRDKLYNWTPLYVRWEDSPVGTENVIAAVDLCSWAYVDQSALAEMAAILALDSDARKWQSLADLLGTNIRNRMWNKNAGRFCDLGPQGRQIPATEAAGILPLLVGIASKDQAEAMMPVLANMELLGNTPGEPAGKGGAGPKSLRPDYAWLSTCGLRRYGANDPAARLSRSIVRMVMEEPTCREGYDLTAHKGSGAKCSAVGAALFIRLCNDQIRYETGADLGLSISEYAATLLPPEDAIVSVTVTNPSKQPLTDLAVKFNSEFPVEGPERKKATLEAGSSFAFIFRAKVPESARGLSYVSAEATAKKGDRSVASQMGRTYALRDHVSVELRAPHRGLILSDSEIAIPGAAVNFRVEPIANGYVTLRMPEGWKVTPPEPQKMNFPFGDTLSNLQFRVEPPQSLPVGGYPLMTEVNYRDHRGQKTLKEESGELWKPIRWAVAGPFDNIGERVFETPYPPEKEVDLQAAMPGKVDERFWRGMPAEWVSGFSSVDFPAADSQVKTQLAYLYTMVISQTNMNVQCNAECDGPFALWINGIELMRQPTGPKASIVPAVLNAGQNHVLIKTCPGEPKWRVRFSFTDGAGKPVTGLVCDLPGLASKQ